MKPRRVRLIPLLAGLIVCVIGVQLGNWQMRRADEKTVLREAIVAAEQAEPMDGSRLVDAPEWRRVTLEGEWVASATVLLDNRIHQGVAGYDVHTPLKLVDGHGWVLVKRGWVRAGQDRSRLPAIVTPEGVVSIEGVVLSGQRASFTLASEPGEGVVVQYLDIEHYRNQSGLPVRDWVLQQVGETNDGLVRQWPRPDAGVDRHHGYAFQWYALASLSLALILIHVSRSLFKHAT